MAPLQRKVGHQKPDFCCCGGRTSSTAREWDGGVGSQPGDIPWRIPLSQRECWRTVAPWSPERLGAGLVAESHILTSSGSFCPPPPPPFVAVLGTVFYLLFRTNSSDACLTYQIGPAPYPVLPESFSPNLLQGGAGIPCPLP